jgi:glycosyltransferase involved in cell wall biosynthesis
MGEAASGGQTEQPTIEASVVVTVRNEAHSIGDLLAALADQTVRPREIVIVDGGSTDETVAVLR